MTIRNFLKTPLKAESIHEGAGLCEHSGILHATDFDTPIRFLNYTIIPPGGSFGAHKHGDDNELYIILEGTGEYEQDGVTAPVEAGDIMVNARFAVHGIKNTGAIPMRVLVIEAYNETH